MCLLCNADWCEACKDNATSTSQAAERSAPAAPPIGKESAAPTPSLDSTAQNAEVAPPIAKAPGKRRGINVACGINFNELLKPPHKRGRF